MTERLRLTRIVLAAIFLLLVSGANLRGASPAPNLEIHITSSTTLNGTAGDFVAVQGTITNIGNTPLERIVTYLSLVDDQTKLPVDLEDWSAEKGLYIGSIDAGQTLPLDWKIHFVKAGTYSLIIVAEQTGNENPQVSTITHFNVKPKINLNPANVLPTAFGTPLLLAMLLYALTSRRRTETKNTFEE